MASRLIRAAEVALAVPALTDVLTSAATYAQAEKSQATRRAYAGDWRDFTAWCEVMLQPPLPASPATVAAYLASLADRRLKASTIARRLAAIGYAHKLKGLDSPASAEPVRAVHRGIRRTIGIAVKRKAPASAPRLTTMLALIPNSLTGLRDRALLLIGFAAALRRSELVKLKVNDLEFLPEGVLLHIGASKTDQEGAGCAVAIPRGTILKPVEALETWLKAAQISEGPIFRAVDRHGHVKPTGLCDKSVADIVKQYARLGNFDAALFGGHSLRAGFITSALAEGADIFKVMDVSRQKRVETLRIYDRRDKAFKDHAGTGFL
jgi:site-specific recombinase XerD